MKELIIIVLIAIVIIVVSTILWGGQLPVPFRARACQGKNWRKIFPQATKDDIREFLSFFTDAFDFNEKEKLKFNPNDQLLDIYCALYPSKWQEADALEFETLADMLDFQYGIKLDNILDDSLTLGQLFSHIQRSGKSKK